MSDRKTQRFLLEMEYEVDPVRLSTTQAYFLIMDALPLELPDADGREAAELQEARFLDYSGAVLRPSESLSAGQIKGES